MVTENGQTIPANYNNISPPYMKSPSISDISNTPVTNTIIPADLSFEQDYIFDDALPTNTTYFTNKFDIVTKTTPEIVSINNLSDVQNLEISHLNNKQIHHLDIPTLDVSPLKCTSPIQHYDNGCAATDNNNVVVAAAVQHTQLYTSRSQYSTPAQYTSTPQHSSPSQYISTPPQYSSTPQYTSTPQYASTPQYSMPIAEVNLENDHVSHSNTTTNNNNDNNQSEIGNNIFDFNTTTTTNQNNNVNTNQNNNINTKQNNNINADDAIATLQSTNSEILPQTNITTTATITSNNIIQTNSNNIDTITTTVASPMTTTTTIDTTTATTTNYNNNNNNNDVINNNIEGRRSPRITNEDIAKLMINLQNYCNDTLILSKENVEIQTKTTITTTTTQNLQENEQQQQQEEEQHKQQDITKEQPLVILNWNGETVEKIPINLMPSTTVQKEEEQQQLEQQQQSSPDEQRPPQQQQEEELQQNQQEQLITQSNNEQQVNNILFAELQAKKYELLTLQQKQKDWELKLEKLTIQDAKLRIYHKECSEALLQNHKEQQIRFTTFENQLNLQYQNGQVDETRKMQLETMRRAQCQDLQKQQQEQIKYLKNNQEQAMKKLQTELTIATQTLNDIKEKQYNLQQYIRAHEEQTVQSSEEINQQTQQKSPQHSSQQKNVETQQESPQENSNIENQCQNQENKIVQSTSPQSKINLENSTEDCQHDNQTNGRESLANDENEQAIEKIINVNEVNENEQIEQIISMDKMSILQPAKRTPSRGKSSLNFLKAVVISSRDPNVDYGDHDDEAENENNDDDDDDDNNNNKNTNKNETKTHTNDNNSDDNNEEDEDDDDNDDDDDDDDDEKNTTTSTEGDNDDSNDDDNDSDDNKNTTIIQNKTSKTTKYQQNISAEKSTTKSTNTKNNVNTKVAKEDDINITNDKVNKEDNNNNDDDDDDDDNNNKTSTDDDDEHVSASDNNISINNKNNINNNNNHKKYRLLKHKKTLKTNYNCINKKTEQIKQTKKLDKKQSPVHKQKTTDITQRQDFMEIETDDDDDNDNDDDVHIEPAIHSNKITSLFKNTKINKQNLNNNDSDDDDSDEDYDQEKTFKLLKAKNMNRPKKFTKIIRKPKSTQSTISYIDLAANKKTKVKTYSTPTSLIKKAINFEKNFKFPNTTKYNDDSSSTSSSCSSESSDDSENTETEEIPEHKDYLKLKEQTNYQYENKKIANINNSDIESDVNDDDDDDAEDGVNKNNGNTTDENERDVDDLIASSIADLDDEHLAEVAAQTTTKPTSLLPRHQPSREKDVIVKSYVLHLTQFQPVKREPKNVTLPDSIKLYVPQYIYKYTELPKNVEPFKMIVANLNGGVAYTDQMVIYEPTHRLKSLAEIREQLLREEKGYFIQDMVIPTDYGKALRFLSQYFTVEQNTYPRLHVNNAGLTPLKYPLVYGAVPDLMAVDYVSWQMYRYYRIREGSDEKLAYIPDGEFEIGACLYTRLASSDLIGWQKDTIRTDLKKMLIYACTLVPDAKLRSYLFAYIDLKDERHITAETLLLIKQNYMDIIKSIRKIPDKNVASNAIKVWHSFMYKCKIHHFLCPHTEIAIKNQFRTLATKLILQLEECELEYSEKDMTGVRFYKREIIEFFSFIPHFTTAATLESLRNLRYIFSTIYSHIVRLLINYLYEVGIFSSALKLTVGHIQGFAFYYRDLISVNNKNIKLPSFESKVTAFANLISKRMARYYEYKLPPISHDAVRAFIYVANLIILKRTEIVIHLRDPDKCRGEALCEQLFGLFESKFFTSIRNISSWMLLDEESSVYDENEVIPEDEKLEFEYGSDKNEMSSCEFDDFDELEQEVADLLAECEQMYVQPNPDEALQTRNKSKQQPKLPLSLADYKQSVEKTPYKNCLMPYNRAICAMCNITRTAKVIEIEQSFYPGETFHVACCIRCHQHLIIDYLAAEPTINFEILCQRIHIQYAKPICFDANYKFIEPHDFNHQLSNSCINRALLDQSSPAAKARKAAKAAQAARNAANRKRKNPNGEPTRRRKKVIKSKEAISVDIIPSDYDDGSD